MLVACSPSEVGIQKTARIRPGFGDGRRPQPLINSDLRFGGLVTRPRDEKAAHRIDSSR